MTTEQWLSICSSFGSAIIGGLIGGGFAIWAGQKSHANSLRLDRVQAQKKINGTLQAIRCELSILGKVYGQQAGGRLESVREGEPFNVRFSLTEKYFIVYPSNTDIVGQIEDPDLVNRIVVTYNTANFLIEMYRINNTYLQDESSLLEVHDPTQQTPQNPTIERKLKTIKGLKIVQAQVIKKVHKDLEMETEGLLKRIEDYLRKQALEE